MIYLADTHALVWYLNEDANLSAEAKSIFEKAEQGETTIIIPTISLLELLFICKKKKYLLQFKALLQKLNEAISYTIYDLDFQVVMACTELDNIPEIHDRVITATAILTGATVITNDEDICRSGYVPILW